MECNIFEELNNPIYNSLINIENKIKELASQLNDLQGGSLSCKKEITNSQQIKDLVDEASYIHKGGFFYGKGEGDEKLVFETTGLANSQSMKFTPKTLYSWGSTGKPLTMLVLTKMMEEGLIESSTTLNSIDPVLYTGYATYFDTISVSNPAFFPLLPASYTYTTKQFNWSNVTIEDLIRFNLGLSNDLFFLPALNLAFFNTAFRDIVIAKNSVQGLGMMIQFAIAYSALLANSPITPGCKIYNGTSYKEVAPTAVASYVQLTKQGTFPLLYNTNTYQDDLLPFNIRSLPATYDLSYGILGDVLDKLLKTKGYRNFSDYVHEKIFTPLNMTNSYIIFQDTVPDTVLSKNGIAENSWRRAPSLGLTATVNISNPLTYLGVGCSPQYAQVANANAAKEPYGPLVWNSQYANDGISYITSFLYCTSAIPDCGPIGNAPFISSIEDMGKLLDCLANKGSYVSCITHKIESIINQTSWGYFSSNKTMPSTVVSGIPYPIESLVQNSASSTSGFTHENRDFTFNTLYGFDDQSFFKNGVTGCTIYLNPGTKLWMIYGYPEAFFSSGYVTSPEPTTLTTYTSLRLMSLYITAINQ